MLLLKIQTGKMIFDELIDPQTALVPTYNTIGVFHTNTWGPDFDSSFYLSFDCRKATNSHLMLLLSAIIG